MRQDQREASPHHSTPSYADVIVPRHIAKVFTYLIPADLAPTITIGSPVLVPFGQTMLEGAVVAVHRRLPNGLNAAHVKAIRSLAETTSGISPMLFELSRKVADEYLAPWGQCLRLVMPPTQTPHVPPIRYVATDQGRSALAEETCPAHLRPLLARIARRSSGILASTLETARERKNRRGLKALEAHQWITATTPSVQETSPAKRKKKVASGHATETLPLVPAIILPKPDSSWTNRLSELLRTHRPAHLLVYAPWEHRTAVLAQAIRQIHAMDKSILIVTGEVARAEWLGHLISSETGLPVCFLHSGLDESAWARQWEQIRNGTAKIVVGTRSAVFAPLPSIGLIWIDGEEDPALKEPQEPRYHARDVAWMRAQTEQAVLVLGSSHPSLESNTDAGMERLVFHDDGSRRPHVELVDLRREPSGTLLSAALLAALRETLSRQDRALLFLNRKGYAGALACRDCGWVPRCPSCAVAIAYYRGAAQMTCRYCGAASAPPDTCPECSGARLNPVGGGTERIEADVRQLFPEARIVRIDSDTLDHSAAGRSLWEQARSGQWDILIGTQALFQREPLPPVGLVGIVQADSGLHVPDFRAAERTYQLLSEAAGLARPAQAGGRVVVQSQLPAHHAMHAVVAGDTARFYEEELAARRLLGYPPVQHLISLSISGKELPVVEEAARQLLRRLEKTVAAHESPSPQATPASPNRHRISAPAQPHPSISILGPVPASSGKPRGHHRRQILVKGPSRDDLHRAVRTSVEAIEQEYRKRQVKCVVDVDPIEMG